MRKRILIIGANGYIGSRLKEDYYEEYDITPLDDCWFDSPLDREIVVRGDFGDLSKEFLQMFDVVILLAGHSSVKMCEGNELSAFDNNVRNFIKLISKLRSNQKFIYASSSSVYGDVGTNIVDETYTNFIPHNHYDITKHIIDLYAPRFDVQYYGLRFGTVNGYAPIVRNDVMINSMVYNALREKKIKLYIKDIVRPILGISDLSRAIKCIIDTDKDHRGIYNLASFNSTAEQIANGVSEIVGVPIEEYPVDPTNITNSKLQTKSYNFSIDCAKFERTFDFKFNESIQSITTELINNIPYILFTSRNKIQEYEK